MDNVKEYDNLSNWEYDGNFVVYGSGMKPFIGGVNGTRHFLR